MDGNCNLLYYWCYVVAMGDDVKVLSSQMKPIATSPLDDKVIPVGAFFFFFWFTITPTRGFWVCAYSSDEVLGSCREPTQSCYLRIEEGGGRWILWSGSWVSWGPTNNCRKVESVLVKLWNREERDKMFKKKIKRCYKEWNSRVILKHRSVILLHCLGKTLISFEGIIQTHIIHNTVLSTYMLMWSKPRRTNYW